MAPLNLGTLAWYHYQIIPAREQLEKMVPTERHAGATNLVFKVMNQRLPIMNSKPFMDQAKTAIHSTYLNNNR